MRLAEFLGEGANDAAYRVLASSICDFIADNIGAHDPDRVIYTEHGITAVWRMTSIGIMPPDVGQMLQRFILFITVTADDMHAGNARYHRQRGWDVLELFQPMNTVLDEESMRELMRRTAAQIVDRRRSSIVHELTHFVDTFKVKDLSKMRPRYDSERVSLGDKEELGKYYSDPFESNARFQEQFAKWERMVAKRVAAGGRAEDVVGSSPKEFLRKFTIWMDAEMRNNMTSDMRRRLVKRATQFWNDITTEYRGGNA